MNDNLRKNELCDLCEINHPHPDKIHDALSHRLDDETSLRLADLFKILGDKTRIKLLSLLVVEKEMCVCDIAESLQMGQSAISHQLRVLRAARLVKYRKDGKEAFYSLDDDHVVKLMCQGLDHVRESMT
ncbi:ArsR/SmtB family transcription factor [Mitsuokella sp.]|uniref:ArsR/SmtB family transcription factor n=1 Tax=unclassified Mitsuokella TaxID=2637239 RepID=UPI003D7C7E21